MSQRYAFTEIDALAFGGEDGNIPTEPDALLDGIPADSDVTGESSGSQEATTAIDPELSNGRESIYVCILEGGVMSHTCISYSTH
jgi:hypothetical protein